MASEDKIKRYDMMNKCQPWHPNNTTIPHEYLSQIDRPGIDDLYNDAKAISCSSSNTSNNITKTDTTTPAPTTSNSN